jgi:hypothetical protein
MGKSYQFGLGGRFQSNSGVWVLSKTGIKDTVRDLITEFVGMSLANGLGGEEEVVFRGIFHLVIYY